MNIKPKWGIGLVWSDRSHWSLGINFTHWFDDNYITINLIFITINIGIFMRDRV